MADEENQPALVTEMFSPEIQQILSSGPVVNEATQRQLMRLRVGELTTILEINSVKTTTKDRKYDLMEKVVNLLRQRRAAGQEPRIDPPGTNCCICLTTPPEFGFRKCGHFGICGACHQLLPKEPRMEFGPLGYWVSCPACNMRHRFEDELIHLIPI